jgi:hypothetical protein
LLKCRKLNFGFSSSGGFAPHHLKRSVAFCGVKKSIQFRMSIIKQQNIGQEPTKFNELQLVLQPSRWQLEAMTFMPLVIFGAFSAVSWFFTDSIWGKLSALIIALLGIWAARAGRRAMRNANVRADAQGISLFDGSRKDTVNQHAAWDDVARCEIENRSNSADSVGQPHIVLKDAANRDLFVLYTKYLSRTDTAHLLRFIRTELEQRKTLFDVPAE